MCGCFYESGVLLPGVLKIRKKSLGGMMPWTSQGANSRPTFAWVAAGGVTAGQGSEVGPEDDVGLPLRQQALLS